MSECCSDAFTARQIIDPKLQQHVRDANSTGDALHFQALLRSSALSDQSVLPASANAAPAVVANVIADLDMVLLLAQQAGAQITAAGQEPLFRMEMELASVLARMECCGIRCDKSVLLALRKRLQADQADLESQAHEQAGREFNLASPAQCAEILYGVLKIAPPKSSKSTATKVMH